MQQFKSKLTRLRSMFDRLPDSGDVYGYAGITKQMLLSTVEGIYALSNDIHESNENQLIVIALKRKCAKFYEQYKTILDSETEIPSRDSFDKFLDDVAELFERTKNVCAICRSGSEDAAVELAQLKGNVQAFKEFVASYDAEYRVVKDSVSRLKEFNDSAEQMASDIKNAHTNSIENGNAIASARDQVEKSANEIDGWHIDIEDCEKRITSVEKNFTNIKEKAEDVAKRYNEVLNKSAKELEDIESLNGRAKDLLDESKETLASANRHSMSASFELRRKELLWPLRIWGIALVLAIGGIAAVVIWGPALDFSQGFGIKVLGPLIFRFALIAPCVWLGWFSGRQYGYTVRVREDYSFKYACSVAYEGFKKAAGEDPVLGQILLELCMLNMAQQPLRVYSSGRFGVKGLPIEEWLDALTKRLPHPESLDIRYGRANLKALFSRQQEVVADDENNESEP